jgi:hypothetical protein
MPKSSKGPRRSAASNKELAKKLSEAAARASVGSSAAKRKTSRKSR